MAQGGDPRWRESASKRVGRHPWRDGLQIAGDEWQATPPAGGHCWHRERELWPIGTLTALSITVPAARGISRRGALRCVA
jgi:hypothetical protein